MLCHEKVSKRRLVYKPILTLLEKYLLRLLPLFAGISGQQ
jgi:hypothetical protein